MWIMTVPCAMNSPKMSTSARAMSRYRRPPLLPPDADGRHPEQDGRDPADDEQDLVGRDHLRAQVEAVRCEGPGYEEMLDRLLRAEDQQ